MRLASRALGAAAFALATAGAFAAPDGDATKPAAPAASEKKEPDAPPASADLRKEMDALGLGPRKQGARNTCSVFTTAAALEFALAKHLGKAVALSPEFLNWACNRVVGNTKDDRGQFFHDLLKGFEKDGICADAEMPYRDRFDPEYAPSKEAVKHAAEIRDAGLRIHWINPWKPAQGLTEEQMTEIRRVLAAGWPVAAGSNHSRLLVGYTTDEKQPGGGTFLTKDSGLGAYGSVTWEFAKTKVGDVFWVERPAPPRTPDK